MSDSRFRTALLAVFLCLPFVATAETELMFGGIGHHVGGSKKLNDFHRTAIISHKHYFAGYFKNSLDEDTFVTGKSFVFKDSSANLVLNAGLSWGYRKSSNCFDIDPNHAASPKIVCPLLAPSIQFHNLPLTPSVTLMGTAVVLNFSYTFND